MAVSLGNTGPEEDRTRFCRLSIVIIDELTLVLRDLLQHEIQPSDIFNEMRHKNVKIKLSAHQLHLIGNAKSEGYSNFDITLLYTLLRNVCPNIPPPTKHWGVSQMPSQNEITVGDDIERIRLIRNNALVNISAAAISEKEFQAYMSDITGICTRMQTLLNKDYLRMLENIK